MRTLLVDNYDSYSYNVFHLLAAACGEEPIVVNNDDVSWRVLSREHFDAIVLSPGPGRPGAGTTSASAGHPALSEAPVLGICLGHQGIGNLLDGRVNQAPMAMHGRLSSVHHVGTGLFAGIPQGFAVVRYHSLAVTSPMGREARITAWSADGVVMGIEHGTRPIWGVQFHPESVATEHGRKLAENFYPIAESRRAAPSRGRRAARSADGGVPRAGRPAGERPTTPCTCADRGRGTDRAALRTALQRRRASFWLDSADAPTWLAQCSFLGTSAGTVLRAVVRHRQRRGRIDRAGAAPWPASRSSICSTASWRARGRSAARHPPRHARRLRRLPRLRVKADCGSPNLHRSDLPDAAMMLANRVIAVDHAHRTHLTALAGDEEPEAAAWLDRRRAWSTRRSPEPPPEPPRAPPTDPGATVEFRCGRGRRRYIADIHRCQAELAAGESYEVCLTDQISTSASPDPFTLYKILRRRNPAPFSAFLSFGEVAIVSSSPERFLSVDRDRRGGAADQGHGPRSEDPARTPPARAAADDEKTFAEHLMIVDLLRTTLAACARWTPCGCRSCGWWRATRRCIS